MTPPPSVDGTNGTATALSASDFEACAIQAGSRKVVCWGFGQSTPPPSVDGTDGTATAIASGDVSHCAIQTGTGKVVCWGYQRSCEPFGGCTFLSPITISPPASVNGTDGTASAIAVGFDDTSCAIQAETGNIVCWDGGGPFAPSVDGTEGTATAIAVGSTHACAIQAGSGAVVCWGNDSYGQATPPPSVDGTNGTAIAIAAGASHSCAIQAVTRKVVCWGNDDYGQATPPPSVDGTKGTATAIAAGVDGFYTLAIQATPEPGRLLLEATSALTLAMIRRRQPPCRSTHDSRRQVSRSAS